jgi:hypothetical protein
MVNVPPVMRAKSAGKRLWAFAATTALKKLKIMKVFSFCCPRIRLVHYRLKPNHLAFLCVGTYADMGKIAVRRCSVSVFRLRRDLNYITLLQKPGRLPPFLIIASTVGNQ